MGLSPSERKAIKRTAICLLFVCIGIAGIIWSIQYYKLRQKNMSLHIDTHGRILVSDGKICPIDIEAHRLVAARYVATNQPEKALPHLERILAFHPNDRESRYRLACAYLEAGRYEQSLPEFSRLEHTGIQDSLTPGIFAREGISLFYLGRIVESKERLGTCLSRFPNSAEAACFLGQIEASESANSPKVLRYLEEAIRLDSTYVEGWYQLARYTMQQGDYRKARQLLAHAIEIDPLHIKSHSRLGMAYYYLGNYDHAKKAYRTALALNPGDFNTLYNLGELYYSALGDTEQALRVFTSTLRLHPRHAEANFKIGLICLRNGMTKEAIRYFRTAAESDSMNTRIMLQLAVAYEKLGARENALETYQRITSFDALNGIANQKIQFLSQR